MRKIESSETVEKRSKVRTRWFTIIILGLLVLSSVGYAFFANPDSNTSSNQNGVQNLGGQWGFKYGEQTHYTTYGPDEVKNVSVEIANNLNGYYGQVIYYYVENQALAYEVVSNIQRYTERMQPACYGANCTEDYPEKTCEDKLIVWTQSNQSKVYQKQNCVFIEGDLKAADAFIYRLFGIN